VSSYDGDMDEMPLRGQIGDELIDALITGDTGEERADHDELTSFIADVRREGARLPLPSPALAAVLRGDISTDKGELPATAASNVSGPAPQASELPKWRALTMKIKTYVAGLGIAAKIVLGVGIATAATTGAGMAGALPPLHGHHGPTLGASAEPGSPPPPSTTTTKAAEPTTTAPPTTQPHTEPGGVPKPPEPTTTTTVKPGEPTTTTAPRTESTNPESIALNCERAVEPNRITCSWTASSDPGHTKYALLRTTPSGPGRVVFQSPSALTFTDTTVTAGATYGYRVVSLRADGSVDSHSNLVTISCC
jgi:hypothetical protein